jgi:hypothetical protein
MPMPFPQQRQPFADRQHREVDACVLVDVIIEIP